MLSTGFARGVLRVESLAISRGVAVKPDPFAACLVDLRSSVVVVVVVVSTLVLLGDDSGFISTSSDCRF